MDVSVGLGEHHVGDYGYSDGAALGVFEIDLAYGDGGTYSHEAGAGQEAAFGHGPEVVHLHFDGSEAAGSVEVLVEGTADGSIGDARGDSAVHRAGAVQQLRAHPALDGQAVAMGADELQAKQVIEGVLREQVAEMLGFGGRSQVT